MSAWEELPSSQRDSAWDRFDSEFAFCPSTTEFPGIREPKDSVTFDISRVYGDAERYERLTMDLSHKLVAALRRCVPESGVVHVLEGHQEVVWVNGDLGGCSLCEAPPSPFLGC